jgi:predicted enzyme related to lactoylglutathione lyase
MSPLDVASAGRMAIVTDPTGATFALWQAGGHIGARLVNDPGSLCLNQLNTGDPEQARGFYEGLFGWHFVPVGTDEQPYWGIHNPTADGEALNGGMMPLPPDATVPSHWLPYFTTADLDAAVARVEASAGTVLIPPMAIESGRIAEAMDPQGAVFALFEGRVDP